MRYLDHNVTGPALSQLGGISDIREVLEAAPGSAAVETLRLIVQQTLAGTVTLVTSPMGLETLYRLLIEGSDDITPLSPEAASASVTALHLLSQASGGVVKNTEVKAKVAIAQELLRDHVGKARGQIDFEDVTVATTCLIAASAGEPVVLVTDDAGLHNCARPMQPFNVAVIAPAALLGVQTGQRRFA